MVPWLELVSTALSDFWPCLGRAFNTRHSGQLTKALWKGEQLASIWRHTEK
jgi:hypothetical protein